MDIALRKEELSAARLQKQRNEEYEVNKMSPVFHALSRFYYLYD